MATTQAPPTTETDSEISTTGRRPIMSASRPKTAEPTICPTLDAIG
jgi:hypothetical protein